MTLQYSSPELLGLCPHSFPSDVWSLALTFHFVITGRESIVGRDLDSMAKYATRLRLSFDDPVWSQWPSSLPSLLLAMTRPDPEERPAMRDCAGHPFFAEFLGQDWISAENEAVKFPSAAEFREICERVKEAALEDEVHHERI
jgi:serine/threonine protein kinase